MFRILIVAALLIPLSFASAHSDSCPPAGEATLAAVGGYYVTATPAIFQETNSRAGLQTSAGECDPGNGRDPISWVADSQIL